MRSLLVLSLLLPALLRSASCDSASTLHTQAHLEPVAVITLPSELRELSGLTLLNDSTLGAIQDEEGILYDISLATGRVTGRSRFHGAGDFEGIERAGATIYALQSDGDVFVLDEDRKDAQKFETPLGSDADTEGLAFDAASNSLFIACKEEPGDGLEDVRAVYAFDLSTNTLGPRPVLILLLDPDLGLRNFKPSALTYHSKTGWWLMTSSTTQQLAALDSTGQLVGIWDLPASVLPQPEGLAVLPRGDLLIGSEGRPARIARFAFPLPSAP